MSWITHWHMEKQTLNYTWLINLLIQTKNYNNPVQENPQLWEISHAVDKDIHVLLTMI